MQIPNKIKIAGVDYITRYSDLVVLNNEECYGECDYEHSTITISNRNNVGHQHQGVTYLHEMLHAIANAYNISLPKKKEEKIIDQFAIGLYQVIKDNEDLFQK